MEEEEEGEEEGEEREERDPQGGGIGADLGTRVKFTSKIKADHEFNVVVVRWDACKFIPLLRHTFVGQMHQ